MLGRIAYAIHGVALGMPAISQGAIPGPGLANRNGSKHVCPELREGWTQHHNHVVKADVLPV